MKFYVSVDMEGIAGIVMREQLIPGERLYEEARVLLTNEVNAVVQSLVDIGASQVVVKDAHYFGLNLLINQLHPAADYCFGGLKASERFAGLDSSFDGALLIGYHAMAGTQRAIRDHTMTAVHWQRLELNGQSIGEIGLDALLFGLYGVPVLLVTGDDKTCSEAKSYLPEVTTYQTKKAYGRHAGLIRSPKSVYAEYPTIIERAVQNKAKCAPFQMNGPFELAIRYTSTDLLDGRYFDGVKDKRIDGQSVVYSDASLLELLNRVM